LHEKPTRDENAATEVRDLLQKVGMLRPGAEPQRSEPLSDPQAFKELASRLAEIVDNPYDLIVVRDLFGDRVLGYQLALITGKPVAVSYQREGVIALEGGDSVEQGARVLIAADTHFTEHSIQAAVAGAQQTGLSVVGVALLLRTVLGEFPYTVWALEDSA
jgi:orotate phosphoribosyltransferase